MGEIAAVMLIEEFTDRWGYLRVAPPVIPNVGDRVRCSATIYLQENVMKVLSPQEQVAVDGTVIERTFIQRGDSWVCHLKLNRHAFQPARPPASGAEGREGS